MQGRARGHRWAGRGASRGGRRGGERMVEPMVETDPRAVRGDLTSAIAAELAAAGFSDAQEIGRGGFGAVYRCWQRALERTVAIKGLTTDLDADNVERFLREQRAMGKLCG